MNTMNPSQSLKPELNKLFYKYLPLKKLAKNETKNYFKQRITQGMQKSMKRRDKLNISEIY